MPKLPESAEFHARVETGVPPEITPEEIKGIQMFDFQFNNTFFVLLQTMTVSELKKPESRAKVACAIDFFTQRLQGLEKATNLLSAPGYARLKDLIPALQDINYQLTTLFGYLLDFKRKKNIDHADALTLAEAIQEVYEKLAPASRKLGTHPIYRVYHDMVKNHQLTDYRPCLNYQATPDR